MTRTAHSDYVGQPLRTRRSVFWLLLNLADMDEVGSDDPAVHTFRALPGERPGLAVGISASLGAQYDQVRAGLMDAAVRPVTLVEIDKGTM